MVSKAAVIAIVAILAVPILLGYALNVEQVTETDYKTTGDAVNTTQLLQTSTAYNYVNADITQLNTNFENTSNQKILPYYLDVGTTKTTVPMTQIYTTNGHPSWGGASGMSMENWEYLYLQSDYSGSGGYLTLHYLTPASTTIRTIDRIHSIYYGGAVEENGTTSYNIYYTYYTNPGSPNLSYGVLKPGSNDYRFGLTDTGSFASDTWYEFILNGYQVDYADISAGWTLTSTATGLVNNPYTGNRLKLPDYSNNIVMTFDLSSITDANYQFNIGYIAFQKTTVGTDITWKVKEINTAYPIDEFEIYYDPDATSNTYQFKMIVDPNGDRSVGSGMYAYPMHYELHYVGQWPDLIGEANYYQNYQFDSEIIQVGTLNLSKIGINTQSAKTPTMRVDAALYRAFEYAIIENKTYNPASFKTNPATTINDPTQYGSSIEFGGNTYNVKNGNITMGTHDIPVKGLVLSSVPNPNGGYDNKIGNTVISTTAAPSAITFNGKWSASITTSAQEEYQVTKTEWKAGDFAWDGIDHNFIMAGLLASLGAFVGVGIYARRTKSSVWPLLIVCGGAALLFFVML